MYEFNMNNNVSVKLTSIGVDIVKGSEEAQLDLKPHQEWQEIQLWRLMRVFGDRVFNGFNVPFETTIRIDPKHLKEITAA